MAVLPTGQFLQVTPVTNLPLQKPQAPSEQNSLKTYHVKDHLSGKISHHSCSLF